MHYYELIQSQIVLLFLLKCTITQILLFDVIVHVFLQIAA